MLNVKFKHWTILKPKIEKRREFLARLQEKSRSIFFGTYCRVLAFS